MLHDYRTATLSETQLSLAHTLDCGQCFRWIPSPDGTWEGVVRGSLYRLGQNALSDPSCRIYTDPVLRDYFDVDTDYLDIRNELSGLDGYLAEACRFAPGIRILRQEPWEALCSFIISQNNNIKRIRQIIERLSGRYGVPVAGTSRNAFPTADALAKASDDELRALGTGFRAPYLLDAANNIASGRIVLDELAALPVGQARARLMEIRGVGPKVADCALLYGLHRLEVFPIDVWMKRVMSRHYPDDDVSRFGRFAGIAQQYLFHLERTGVGISHDASVARAEDLEERHGHGRTS